MTSPKPYRHLQIFSICLTMLVCALGVFLFGVRIEHSARGKGILFGGNALHLTAPTGGTVRSASDTHQGIQPGTIGQGLQRLIEIVTPQGAVLAVDSPILEGFWMIGEWHAQLGDSVRPGQNIGTILALKNGEGDLLHPKVRAEFTEKQFGEIRVGQAVRIRSNMYLPRTQGTAEGVVESILPRGTLDPHHVRTFGAVIRVERSPFPLISGSSVELEVILGRKETFRVILEH